MNIQKTVVTIVLLSSVFGSYAKKSRSSTVSCVDIKEQLAEIKATQEAHYLELNNSLDQINQELDNAKTCGQQFFIDQEFMNSATLNPITQSGTYCLVESVTGDLVIDADDVVINMNGFTISDGNNLISSTDHSNITIQGFGVLKDAASAGVQLITCTGVIVDAINFEDCGSGLRFFGVDVFSVTNCSVVGSLEGMAFLTQDITDKPTSNGKVISCSLHDNMLPAGPSAYVLECVNCINVLFENIDISNNSGASFLVGVRALRSSNLSFINCKASNNNATNLAIWSLDDVTDCLVSKCEAKDNGISPFFNTTFMAINSNKVTFESCKALNASGFLVAHGFRIESSSNCSVLNCLAKDISRAGYEVQDSTCCYFNNNSAIDNGTGYNLVGGNINVAFVGNHAENNGVNYSTPPSIISGDTFIGEFNNPSNSCSSVSFS